MAKRDPIIGIDLGTTNSLAAWCDAAGPTVLPGDDGGAILPSVVRYDEAGAAVEAVGVEARRHAVEHPTRTIHSVKRLMGRGAEELAQLAAQAPYPIVPGPRGAACVAVGERVLTPQQVSADILRALRDRATARLGLPVRRAVVTVPAYFDDSQRQATRDAGRLAGLEVVRIVNEPTAAALAYNIGLTERRQTAAVFDLGGGTFDVSILKLERVGEQTVDGVLATAGDTQLGGDDVDRMIIDVTQRELRQRYGEQLEFPPSTRQAFRNLAEAVKIRLSEEQTASMRLELGQGREPYDRTWTRDELETLARPWVDRAMACCRQAMRQAKLAPGEIDRVILVGGSTRMPLVRAAVEAMFEQSPYTAMDPDQVVAMGAAVQAAILAGVRRDALLLDVIPLSLGIETLGGAVAKIIPANTSIPTRASETFSTYVDGQTKVKIHVLQGERELAADCRSLGEFELTGVPPMPAGLPQIQVDFLVDANGVLSVRAVERRSEKAASIQVTPQHGLTREEVDRIERESLACAVEDMRAHRLIDLKNQARFDLRQIDRQLAKVGSELSDAERARIESKMAAVREMLDAAEPDADAFAEALRAMDHGTVRLAELAVAQVLRDSDGPGDGATPGAARG